MMNFSQLVVEVSIVVAAIACGFKYLKLTNKPKQEESLPLDFKSL